MATWHQQRAGRVLTPAGKYTVVTDPPNQLRTHMVFGTMEEAQTYLVNLSKNQPDKHQYSYIIFRQ